MLFENMNYVIIEFLNLPTTVKAYYKLWRFTLDNQIETVHEDFINNNIEYKTEMKGNTLNLYLEIPISPDQVSVIKSTSNIKKPSEFIDPESQIPNPFRFYAEANEDGNIFAAFELKKGYVVDIDINKEEGGQVSGSIQTPEGEMIEISNTYKQAVPYGSKLKLTALPDTEYKFDGWTATPAEILLQPFKTTAQFTKVNIEQKKNTHLGLILGISIPIVIIFIGFVILFVVLIVRQSRSK
jgi:hypothetical protein